MPRTICWFDELDSGDTASAGGRGAMDEGGVPRKEEHDDRNDTSD